MNNSKLLYVSKYTNLIGGAGETTPLTNPSGAVSAPPMSANDPTSDAANQIAAANGQPAAANGQLPATSRMDQFNADVSYAASSAAAGMSQAATAIDTGMHDMHAMADSVGKNTQATAFAVLWIIFSLVMLVLLGMRSNDSKNKGGAFTLFTFGLLFWFLALYFGMGNDQVGESSGYAQASLTISSFFFYFCLYASSDEDGSKKINLWGTIFVVLMSHLFGAFWVSICYSEDKAKSMGHMDGLKGSIGKKIGFDIPGAATAAATGV